MIALNIKLRDHRTDAIPLGVPVVYCQRVGIGSGSFAYADWQLEATIFNADVYDEDRDTADSDGYTPVTDYTDPAFANQYCNRIEIRTVNVRTCLVSDEVLCNGYEFVRKPILWALYADVQQQLDAVDAYLTQQH